MEVRKSKLKLALGAGCALAILASAANASAEERTFNVASARAADTIPEFARQAGIQIVAPADRLQGVKTPAIEGSYDTRQALAMLIAGTGLHVASDDGRTVMLSADPQSGSAAGDGADGTVAALVVTAQKKEENIQDVPIAISAFTEKALEEQKIEGGFDLLKAIPNVTFSKNNFTSYNFSIRGIGTKAVSVTTDPGVAVEFNSTPLIRNRLFEQEYFDVERVEVLRGPQGTLHGRNATAGVINVISSKPNMDEFKGWFRGEVGNYHTKRISAMVNVPLVQEKLAIRLAGALTNRAGYDYNSVTQHHINGRALWSGRVTASFNPTERVRADLIWERFNEDDDRSRTGKQLCHRDAGPSTLGPFPLSPLTSGVLSQGCKPGSLYDDDAFGTPNGLSIPFIQLYNGNEGTGAAWPVMRPVDPYGGLMQSRDLRTIASVRDPVYRARADVIELNFTVDIAPNLILTVTNTYNKDRIYSFQDYNRFNSLPVFYNTSDNADSPGIDWKCAPSYSGCVDISGLAPGGVFTDPQIGPSNTVAGFDVSKARSSQYSSEVRIESSFADGINFSAGANFTRYSTLE
ncbi:MAG: TonB-dependent receptor plug domain-containing protein, partial [Parcubacteria group bacterium]